MENGLRIVGAEGVGENDVRLLAERKEGEGFRVSIAAPDAAAALTGISLLVEQLAAITGIPVEGVISRLAVVMLTDTGVGTEIPQ